MPTHPVVSRSDWLAARQALVAEEKAMSAARDALAAKRRALPWVEVTTAYSFDTPSGTKPLIDLFAGRGQLFVYHFMLAPSWNEGCKNCSCLADHFGGMLPHLAARDVTLTAVSRAPLATIDAFKARMGWTFPWVSSAGTTFNFDFNVSFAPDTAGQGSYNYAPRSGSMEELPGASVFARDEQGRVFHTYSTYARGLDQLLGMYNVLDLMPKGRDEAGLPYPMSWIKHHDKY